MSFNISTQISIVKIYKTRGGENIYKIKKDICIFLVKKIRAHEYI